MARRLILVRHGAVEKAFQGRFLGRTDCSLGSTGRRQAEALAAVLREAGVVKCYCSPLARSVQTAELAGVEIELLDDLREMDFGTWETKSFEEISSQEPKTIQRWVDWGSDFAFPEGERIADFLTRVAAVAQRLADDEVETVLAITHAGVIRAMICHLLGLDSRSYVLFNVDYASLTRLDLFEGKAVLAGLNDVCHLTSE